MKGNNIEKDSSHAALKVVTPVNQDAKSNDSDDVDLDFDL
jgi:hypothetical protein